MGGSTIDKATDIAQLAIIAGILYMGYKFADGLGWFKKNEQTPNGETPPNGSIIPTGGNPVLDYWAQQPTALAPTQTDMSKLTPAIQTPLGPAALGVPDLFSGAVAKTANTISIPIMSTVWEYMMARNLGDNWRNEYHWNGSRWVKNLDPVKQSNLIQKYPGVASRPEPSRVIEQVKTGGFKSILLPGGVKQSPAPEKMRVASSLSPTAAATKAAFIPSAPQPKKVVSAPMKSQSMGGTGSEIQDTPGVLDYLNIGKAPNDQLDPKYRTVQGDERKPSAWVDPKTGAISSVEMPGWIAKYGLIPTKQEPPKPVTIPAPSPAIVNPVASGPINQQVLPAGQVSYNWQSGQVSRYLLTGPGWMQISEAEARSRGMIK